MFSDGVFAVLITVLVLELRPPQLPTFKALFLLWPTWLSYAVSYLFIAIVWVNHHHLLRYATAATARLMWFNFAHLFSVSLLPLSTAWMAVSELAPQPVAFYAAVFFLVDAIYRFDLGACGTALSGGRNAQGAQDHALSGDHDLMCFRQCHTRGVEISLSWARNVHLLLGGLSQTGGARSEKLVWWFVVVALIELLRGVQAKMPM